MMSKSYDIRIVSFRGKPWNNCSEMRLWQVIAEGPNHTVIAEGTGEFLDLALDELMEKLENKDYAEQQNGNRIKDKKDG